MLPADQITPDLEAQTCEAVRRYCRARIHAVGQDQRILRMDCLRIMCAEGLSCNFKWHYHVWKGLTAMQTARRHTLNHYS